MSDFKPQEVAKSAASAINHTLAKVKTQAIREITSRYNIDAATARSGMSVQKTNHHNLYGKLMAETKTLPMVNFKPVEIKSGIKTFFSGSKKKGGFVGTKTKEKSEGLTIEILKGQKKTLNSAFLYFGKTIRGITVKAFGVYSNAGFDFTKEGEGKASVLKTVSVYGALRSEQVLRRLQDKARTDYADRLIYELTKGSKYRRL